ncbi:hypothetical protein ACFT0G_15250 [Streptomyces sp. NPDC057020]|uniref:hypothetical protein n=1 Tax=unclassified Streptomyces TaxID=2593676 RepID=UPI00363DA4A5
MAASQRTRWLTCCLDLVETSAFGGVAAKRDLPRDLGELVFEGAPGGVRPFARPVRLAAAEDEAETFGGGVVEAGDPDPGVLLCLGEFLLGGDVLGPVLFLEDKESHGLALCGNGEVWICPAAAMGRGCEAGLSRRTGMSFGLGSGDQRLDEPEGTSLDGLREAHWLLFVLHCPDHGVRTCKPRWHRDGFEDRKAPGGDVDELDLVPALAPAPVQLLRLRDPSGPACRGDAGRPLLQARTAAALDDPAAGLRELLQQLLGERHAML